jgi:nucleotide-binding universal stress UspA family protein
MNKVNMEGYMFKKILVGFDGSKGGRAALKRAITLAKHYDAFLKVLWVRQPLPRYADLPGEPQGESEEANEYFQKLKSEVDELAAQNFMKIEFEMRYGHPAKVIVNYAKEEDFDLIVVGHSDHSELWGRLLGDTADRISDHAHCSVLIVKN